MHKLQSLKTFIIQQKQSYQTLIKTFYEQHFNSTIFKK